MTVITTQAEYVTKRANQATKELNIFGNCAAATVTRLAYLPGDLEIITNQKLDNLERQLAELSH